MFREQTPRGKVEGWEMSKKTTSIDIHTLLCVKQIASGKLLKSTWRSALCSVMTQRGERGWSGREAQEGRHICTHIIDSRSYTAETKHNVIKQSYSSLKKLKNKQNHRLITFMNNNGKIVNKRLTKILNCTIKEYYITQNVNYFSGPGKRQCYT